MNSAIVKSVRGNRTLYFAGWSPKKRNKPRFTPNLKDAIYLGVDVAKNVRDALCSRTTKVSLLLAPAPLNLPPALQKGEEVRRFKSKEELMAYMRAA